MDQGDKERLELPQLKPEKSDLETWGSSGLDVLRVIGQGMMAPEE
jgi:hypothetical protein